MLLKVSFFWLLNNFLIPPLRDGDMMKKSAKRKVITEHSSEPNMRGPMPKKRKKKKTQSK